jgi:uncharacterized iron-regulated membrane protein
MRAKLNKNPLAQIGLIAVLALVAGLVFMMRMGASTEEAVPAATDPAATEPAPDPAAAPASTDPTSPASAAPATAPSAAPAPVASPSAPAPAATGAVPSTFVAGPGLPAPVVHAYEQGKTVVLMVTRHGGIDDRRVRDAVKALKSSSKVVVFFTVIKHVARYSRITQGVDLDRSAALIVLSPKSVTKGPMPEATVSYGYRNLQSVEQTIRDAGYTGPKLSYHP